MKSLKYFVLIALGLACIMSCGNRTNKNTSTSNQAPPAEYQLVWSDEFDGSGLPDSTKWGYDTEGNDHGWGNNEAQFYTTKRQQNSKVENGMLHITALKESFHDKEYTSARLFTKTDWKYGRFETRAKLPAGRGTWAAIWMMPGGWSFNDGNWPDVGEFDIMEHVGHDPGVIHASAHSRDYQWQKGTQQTDTMHVADAIETFHTYTWEWSPNTVKAYVDDELYFEYKNEGLGESKWPYEKPFYLILNVAVGGAWGSMKGIDDTAFPQTMEVDYVRVYQKK
ncbi:glycoside hydrolase family 16 protein [uncultured Draconibacterium sp.]|uniref:glycoside hydrolase family 16 protein n=1 Tax=uncultured Draconibacterium sp. TaxID=1573823 RepID=UPI0032613419